MDRKSYLGSITKLGLIGYGSFSDVYECGYFDYRFAYKEYTNLDYVKFINERLLKLPEIVKDSDFVVPYEFIYKNPKDDYFLGYIMTFYGNYYSLDKVVLSYDEKIMILKKAREIIEKLHNKYNILHTDICPWNFLYDFDSYNLKLIDFDSYINLDNKEKKLNNFYSVYTQNYGNTVGVDKDLDMYLFNLTTYSLLYDIDYSEVLNSICKNNIDYNNENIRKIFDSYKNIECNKSLKKEYVIDYL